LHKSDPLISIVTINRNHASGLDKTITSINAQTWHNWEHLIQDGRSLDASVAVANSFAERRRILVSEADSGIYDAMNRGLIRVRGDLVWFLNSGDTLVHDRVLEDVAQSWVRNSWGWAYGDLYVGHEESPSSELYQVPGLSEARVNLGREFFPHPSCVFSTRLAKKVGGYRLDLGLSADQYFCLQAKRLSEPHYIGEPLALFEPGGVSGRNTILGHELGFHRFRVRTGSAILSSRTVDLFFSVARASALTIRAKAKDVLISMGQKLSKKVH